MLLLCMLADYSPFLHKKTPDNAESAGPASSEDLAVRPQSGPSLTGIALLEEKVINDQRYKTLLEAFNQVFDDLVSGYDADGTLTPKDKDSRKEELLELVFFHRNKTLKDEKSIQHPSKGSVLYKTNAALRAPTEHNQYKGEIFEETKEKINSLKDEKVKEWKSEKPAGSEARPL